MNQRRKDEAGLKGLSEEEFRTVYKDVEHDVVESEIKLVACKLHLAQATEEREFRDAGKPRRPPEEWGQQWFDAVNEIAAAHQLERSVVWEVARKIEPTLEREYRAEVSRDCKQS